VSSYKENTDLAEVGQEILIVPFFRSVTAQLSAMRGKTEQNDDCSFHRRAQSGE